MDVTVARQKRYEGKRSWGKVGVTVNGTPLNPRLDLFNHSPDGFEWSYSGSGPAQLALAILADHLSDDMEAFNFHQRFKWTVIAELPRRYWILTSNEIDQYLDSIRSWKARGAAA